MAPYTGSKGRTIVDYYLDANNQLIKLLDPLRLLRAIPQGSMLDITGSPTMQRDPNAGNIPGISVQTAVLLTTTGDYTPPNLADAETATDPLVANQTTSSSVISSEATLLPSPSFMSPPGSSDWGYNKTRRLVTQLSSIFYLVQFECGLGGGPATTVDDFSSFMFNTSDSMSDYVSYCSLGKAQLTPRNTKVVNLVLPCQGTSPATGNTFDATRCDSNTLVELAYLADFTAWNQSIDHMAYVHHVLVYPNNLNSWATSPGDPVGCSWAGKSVVGMAKGTWSYIWISGDFWQQQQLYFHEMGHNWNLGHAGAFQPTPPPSFDATQISLSNAQWIDHGDWSDAMGYCCSKRCFNAPHNWQMGWSLAALTLDSSSLLFGQSQILSLTSQALATHSFIAIVADWLPYNTSNSNSNLHTYFLSFRPKNEPNDVTVAGFNDGLLVNLYDGRLQNQPLDSFFIGMVPSTASYTLTVAGNSTGELLSARSQASISDWLHSSGLVVTLLDTNISEATISICRRDPNALSNPENTLVMCNDGLDNDCNGLTDAEDPACIALLSSLIVDGSVASNTSSSLSLDAPPSPNFPSRPQSPQEPTLPPRPPRARRPLPQQSLGLKRSLRAALNGHSN